MLNGGLYRKTCLRFPFKICFLTPGEQRKLPLGQRNLTTDDSLHVSIHILLLTVSGNMTALLANTLLTEELGTD